MSSAIEGDPRLWTGGTAVTSTVRLSLPAGLSEGAYTVGLRLADRDSLLAGDPRYSVRFATQGMWNAAAGVKGADAVRNKRIKTTPGRLRAGNAEIDFKGRAVPGPTDDPR